MKWVERFRENHPEGLEVWGVGTGYENPFWTFSIWLSLDKWGLGFETEVDPGGRSFDGHRFFAIQIGPLALVAFSTFDAKV